MSRLILALAGVLLLALSTSAYADASSLRGRLILPGGVDATSIEARLHDRPATELESLPHGEPVALSHETGGRFTAETTSPTLGLIIEFTGPTVRRARFPWPDSTAERAVFRLENGVSSPLTVVDSETGAPVAGVRVGGVYPAEESSADSLEKAYTFFAHGDADGKVQVTGLQKETPYWFPVYAPGYERQRLTLPSGAPQQVSLRRGGASLAGRLIGDNSGQLYPGEIVQLMARDGSLFIQVLADDKGEFRIDGIPLGEYLLNPVIERLGGMKPAEISFTRDQRMVGYALEVFEGIDISGVVVDVETGLPIRGATVLLREIRQEASRLGAFRFDRIIGPWPVDITAEAPGYEQVADDQDSAMLPVNGFEGVDRRDIAVKLRRIRWLETRTVSTTSSETLTAVPTILEMVGPIGRTLEEPTRLRIAPPIQLDRLESAGTRIAFVRRTDGLSAELAVLSTEQEQTTTTLDLDLGPGAAIRGFLRYDDGPPAPAFRAMLRTTIDAEPVDWLTMRPDEEGNFAADGLPPGEFELRFVRADDTTILVREIQLVRGERLILEEELPRGYTLAGRVLSPEGAPQREIPLVAYGIDPLGQPMRRQVMSGEGGVFSLEGFGSDRISEITIEHHEWKLLSLKNIAIPDENYEIRLTPRDGVTIRGLASSGALMSARGHVLFGQQRSDESAAGQWYFHSESAEPFAGAETVTVKPSRTGRIQVAIEADGKWDVSAPFEWSPSSPPMEIELTPVHRSQLEVIFPGLDEKAIRATTVSLLNTSLPEGSAETVYTGRFGAPNRLLFENIPAGQYLLLATSATGASERRTNLYIAGGARERLELAMKESLFAVTGVIYTDAKARKPAEGAALTVSYGDIPEPEPLGQAVSDKAGRFEFPAVPAGRPLLIQATRGEMQAMQYLQPLSAAADVEIAFPTAVTVRFRLSTEVSRRAGESPIVPFILTPDRGGAGLSFRGDAAGGSHRLYAGPHHVYWGEDKLGMIEIPENGGTVDLPDPWTQ